MKRFKRLTMGHPIIMGRKTFESIGRPLPGRTNIVITRNPNYHVEGCDVAASLDTALAAARQVEPEGGEIFIIGGGEIYALSLERAHRLYLTVVDDDAPAADAFFPAYDHLFAVANEEQGEGTDPPCTFQVLERRKTSD